MRRTTMILLAVVVTITALGMPAYAEPKTNIIFAEVGWDSIRFHNAVAGVIAEVDTPEGMSAHPANEYVHKFIDSADRSKVLTVQSVMITPTSLVRTTDRPSQAIETMRRNAFSTVYVVDQPTLGSLSRAVVISLGKSINCTCEQTHLAGRYRNIIISSIQSPVSFPCDDAPPCTQRTCVTSVG